MLYHMPKDATMDKSQKQKGPGRAGRCCGHCGSTNTSPFLTSGLCLTLLRMPEVFQHLQSSRHKLGEWVFAMYLMITSLKGVSNTKIHRDLKITQKTARYLVHRIRQAWMMRACRCPGPNEVNESYFSGLEKNHHQSQERGTSGVVGKTVVAHTDRATLHGFVGQRVVRPAKLR